MILRRNRLISISTTWLWKSPVLLTEGVLTPNSQMSDIKASRESDEIRTIQDGDPKLIPFGMYPTARIT